MPCPGLSFPKETKETGDCWNASLSHGGPAGALALSRAGTEPALAGEELELSP